MEYQTNQQQSQTIQGQNDLATWQEIQEFKDLDWAEGIYLGKITKLEDKEGKFSLLKRVFFEVANEGHGIATLIYTVPAKCNVKNRTGDFVKRLGIPEGMSFHWSGLVGKTAKLLLKRKTFEKNGQKVTRLCITEVV